MRATERFVQMWILCAAIFVASAPAQTLTIRLINGKTGKPLGNKNVNVSFWWEDPTRPYKDKWVGLNPFLGADVYIDKAGTGHIQIPPNATRISVRPGSRVGNEPFRIPYIACSNPSAFDVPVEAVLRSGFVPANECKANLNVKTTSGEIVYLATPLPWWLPDMQ
jgi:hypothetical protein